MGKSGNGDRQLQTLPAGNRWKSILQVHGKRENENAFIERVENDTCTRNAIWLWTLRKDWMNDSQQIIFFDYIENLCTLQSVS